MFFETSFLADLFPLGSFLGGGGELLSLGVWSCYVGCLLPRYTYLLRVSCLLFTFCSTGWPLALLCCCLPACLPVLFCCLPSGQVVWVCETWWLRYGTVVVFCNLLRYCT